MPAETGTRRAVAKEKRPITKVFVVPQNGFLQQLALVFRAEDTTNDADKDECNGTEHRVLVARVSALKVTPLPFCILLDDSAAERQFHMSNN